MQKSALFLQLHYKNNKHLITNLVSQKKCLISDDNLYNFLDNDIFSSLKRNNKKFITIFVLDLAQFAKSINMTFSTFSFKNLIYCLKYKNALFPHNRLIFKDIAHFMQNNKPENLLEYIQTFHLFASKIMAEFNINIYGCTILSLTSLANTIFKKISFSSYKKIKSLNNKEDAFIRKSFYGGRNEIIKPLINKTYAYDINSLYPFIMAEHSMPIEKATYIQKVKLTKEFFGFVDVIISAPNITLPVLPIKSDNDHAEMGIIYPCGSWRGIYFSEELKFALNYGYKIIEVFDGYSFKKENLFKPFIDKLYLLRKNENDPKIKKLYKLLMNSLYGKYASIYENRKRIINSNETLIEIIKTRYETVAISSAISAYARIFMYDFVVKNKLDLFYWDTDGIIIKNILTKNIDKNLGQFRLVGKIQKGVCLANKFYIYLNESEYCFILRSIPQENYVINGPQLYSIFLSEMQKMCYNNFELTINLPLVNKKENTMTNLCFTFHNKRKYLLKGDTIISEPWIIEPAI